jgi:Cft2 family RNA processing exonuclease
MFHWEDGLMLTRAALAIDFQRRQPRAYISHAHSDHIARHEYALCTPATAALYQHRLGKRPTRELPYRQPIEWGGLRLTTYPAGHCLGSSMLLAEDGDRSLLYTGDFKLGPSATAEQAELPHADVLVIESTYGDPHYRLPPRAQAIEQLLTLVHAAIVDSRVPVVFAYSLGKSQELTKILTDAGFPVVQHHTIYGVSQVYEACGMPLGRYSLFAGRVEPGEVLMLPPRTRLPDGLSRTTTISASGWAVAPWIKHHGEVEHAIPLSDHADYDELFEAVRRVSPDEIYCTHGPVKFVNRLRDAGFRAYPLGGSRQEWLF